MGLMTDLCAATDLPAEITLNVCVEDGLTNVTPCTIKKLDYRVPIIHIIYTLCPDDEQNLFMLY